MDEQHSSVYRSASREIWKVEFVKFRETLTDNADGNPEPSLVIGRCRDLTAKA